MRKLLSLAVGAAMFAGIVSTQQLKAQVYADFNLSNVQSTPYTSVEGKVGTNLISLTAFKEIPSENQDLDNGYALVTLPFPYHYNGISYSTVWVSVNGFIQFAETVNSLDADNPMALFTSSASYPENVIAPFWGDHYYRTAADVKPVGQNQYAMSSIMTNISEDGNCFTIEWKDLNIIDPSITSSVASFQVKLYKTVDPNTNQGIIEFAYGTAGPKSQTSDTRVITSDASIGIKGWTGLEGNASDYLNAILANSTKDAQKSTLTLSSNWPPSGATDKVFRFDPIIKYYVHNSWGDGDADMSKGATGIHSAPNTPQNIYVTPNDAKIIMTSVVTGVPMDSVAGRAAFHGDVNHNGRYVYDISLTKRMQPRTAAIDDYTGIESYFPIGWQNATKYLRYQVTEFDAALILHYMANKVPTLPWLLDTVVNYGKVEAKATSVQFGAPVVSLQGTYTMPVSLNGFAKGAIATKFDIDGIIEDVQVADEKLAVEFSENRVVLAGSTEFVSGEAICWITFRANDNDIEISNITYNDTEIENMSLSLASVGDNEAEKMLNNYPNPFNNSTVVSVNVEKSGFYTLSIYDMQGSLVKTLLSANVAAGLSTHQWDGTDNSGNKVQSGMYIYRLIGNGVSVSNTMQLVK